MQLLFKGLQSKHKRLVHRDTDFWKNLDTIKASGVCTSKKDDYWSVITDATINNMIRRHFHELTEKFLAPLNRYFATLIPSSS